jgi:thiol-disulfide isomerase/thioredoxin
VSGKEQCYRKSGRDTIIGTDRMSQSGNRYTIQVANHLFRLSDDSDTDLLLPRILQRRKSGSRRTQITRLTSLRKINGDQIVFIDFWAEWCGPCKAIKPLYESLSNDHGSVAAFYSVDIDKQEQVAQEIRITSVRSYPLVRSDKGAHFDNIKVPTIIAFKDGNAIGTVVGSDSRALSVRLSLVDVMTVDV